LDVGKDTTLMVLDVPPRIYLIFLENKIIGLYFCHWYNGSIFVQFLWWAP